jgi:hypothetical protein
MTTSVFIPAIPNHFNNLDNVLDIYLNKSTVKPDEIIVSMSDYTKINSDDIRILVTKYNTVKFFLFENVMLAGPNRQVSKNLTNCDIIIYQDADDLPHIQRVEVINHFFNNYDIQHLNHSYVNNLSLSNYNEDFININDINIVNSDEIYNTFFPNKSLTECASITNAYTLKYHTHAGAVAIRREVLNDIFWKDRHELSYSPGWDDPNYKGAEDYEFCMETLFKYNKSIIIDSPIYFYYG